MKVISFLNRTLMGFMIFITVLNGAAPMSEASGAFKCALFQETLENQPLIHYYSTISAIPIRIVNRLFMEDNLPCDGQRNDSREQNTAAGSSSRFFTLNDYSVMKVGRNCLHRHPGEGMALPAAPMAMEYYAVSPADRPGMLPTGTVILCLFVLLFMILPRGELDDSATKNKMNAIARSSFGLTGFFYLGGKLQ